MDYKRLTRIINKYKYEQASLLNRKMKIYQNSEERELIFRPFYDYYSQSEKGSCSELVKKIYPKLIEEFPEHYVLRADGHDPKFFFDLKSNHCFLLISEIDLPHNKNYTTSYVDIHYILARNPLIIDPSFKVIGNFEKSEYRIKRLIGENCTIEYQKDQILEHDSFIPIVFDSKNRLIGLRANFDVKEKIMINILKNYEDLEDSERYPLYSRELDEEFRRDSRVWKYIKFLRSKEIITDQCA